MNDGEIKLPRTFTETVQLVEQFALNEIEQETQQKKLYYHTVAHAYSVKRRANLIFNALKSTLEPTNSLQNIDRINSLINLCAIAHDMVQEFVPANPLNLPRKRLIGISEIATIIKLCSYINSLNQKLRQTKDCNANLVGFTDRDLNIIQQGIKATICNYDVEQGSIYQPLLYKSKPKLSIVARIIALADLGTLGIEGIEAYFREGSLIFLEENLDIAELILSKQLNHQNQLEDLANSDEIRQRLLQTTRLTVNFAKGRKARFEQEIKDFSKPAQNILQQQVFKYLKEETIKQIEALTPTDDRTSLAELLNFFQFEQYLD